MKILALTILLGLPVTTQAQSPKPPNVLFIIADDLRPELNCYGMEGIISPNIDRLAEMGMLFHNAYAQYSVCNPSRASFLTGLRPEKAGIVSNKTRFREAMPDIVSLPQLFRQNGYFTAGIGKIFHMGQDETGEAKLFHDPLSWDYFFDSLHDAPRIGRTGEGRNLTDGRLKWCAWLAANGGDDAQPDGINTKAALRIIEERHAEPFFLALGLHKPHDPFIAPKEYFELYPKGSTKLPVAPPDRSPQVRLAIPNSGDFDAFTDKERREFKRAYQACVSFIDAQIGKIFDAMDRHNLWDNTIVIMIGDHGYHLGEHGWWNKVTVHEIGSRAPMIAWIPGAKGMGRPTRALTEFVDLYPTLVDYAGLKAPHAFCGHSLRPVFDAPDHPGKDAAFSQVYRGKIAGRSVRTQRWRYTEWGPQGRQGIELYDHESDQGEYYNLADHAAHAETRKHHAKLLAEQFSTTKP